MVIAGMPLGKQLSAACSCLLPTCHFDAQLCLIISFPVLIYNHVPAGNTAFCVDTLKREQKHSGSLPSIQKGNCNIPLKN